MKLVLMLLVCVPTFAAQPLTVENAGCKGNVGNVFVYTFKQQVQASTHYVLDQHFGYHVNFVCGDEHISSGSGGRASLVSVLLTTNPDGLGKVFVIYHSVMMVGRSRIDDMAKATMADIDSQITNLEDIVRASQ